MRVGFVGWRGMVGSVLMGRMREEKDFDLIEPIFFTTSNVGGQGPEVGRDAPPLQDARDVDLLRPMDAIISCQGTTKGKCLGSRSRKSIQRSSNSRSSRSR